MRPDRETLTIWSCLAALGVLTSLALAEFAGVRFAVSIWFSVSAFLAAGMLGMRGWTRRVERMAARETRILQTKEIPEVGTVRQLPDRWAAEIGLPDETGAPFGAVVSIDAGDGGPSERQVELIRAFKKRYPGLKPVLTDRLRAYLESGQAGGLLETVDLTRVSVHVNADGERPDLEVSYPSNDGSDMFYVLHLEDWRVVAVYGAD